MTLGPSKVHTYMGFVSGYLAGFIRPHAWRRLTTWSADELAFTTSGPGILILFLPHMVVSVGMLVLGLVGLIAWPFGIHLHSDLKGLGACLFAVLMGAIFSIFLVPLILGRERIYVRRPTRDVVHVKGLKVFILPFLPVWQTRSPFDAFSRIGLIYGGTYETASLRLERKEGGVQEIIATLSENEARETSEDLSRLMGLPIHDSTVEPALERAPEHLDESLRERTKRTNVKGGLPGRPSRLAAHYEVREYGVTATFARPSLKGWPLLKIFLVGLCVFALAGRQRPVEFPERPAYRLQPELDPDDPGPPSLWPWRIAVAAYVLLHGAYWVAGATCLVSLLVLLAKVFWTQLPGFRIEATAHGLQISWKRWLISRHLSLPQASIEELRVGKDGTGRRHLVAVTHNKFIRFAWGLKEEEAKYLRDVLAHALSQADPSSGKPSPA